MGLSGMMDLPMVSLPVSSAKECSFEILDDEITITTASEGALVPGV